MIAKKILLSFAAFLYSFGVWAQDTFKVVNWNIEYFGDRVQNPPRQVQKVIEIMQHIDADVYALAEIVSKDSLQKVANALGSNYAFTIATYGSLSPDTQSTYYPTAQKLAFLYKKSRIKVLRTRPYMASSTSAYYNFATGRMPYLVEAELMVGNNVWKAINFFVVHAKAMSDNQSCMRRTAGALEWKDSLDTHLPNKPFILLGDFNDDFDYSICGGVSNYLNFVSDSTGSNYYFSPTLAPSFLGINSIYGFSGFIDHVLVSDEVKPWYVSNSAHVLSQEVENWVANYTDDVSDHYPVLTKYVWQSPSAIGKAAQDMDISIAPNPCSNILYLQEQKHKIKCCILLDQKGKTIPALQSLQGSNVAIDLSMLANGLYYLQVHLANGSMVMKKINVLH